MRVLSLLSLLCLGALGVSGQSSFVIDGASDPNKWLLASLAGVANPTLNFTAGMTYTFDQSAATTTHPFNFSTVPSNNQVTALDPTFYTVSGSAGCTANTLGGYAAATAAANTCVVSLTIAASAPAATIYYQCTKHGLMSGKINVLAAGGGATTATPTTPAPTGPISGQTIVANAFSITGATTPTYTGYIFTAGGKQYLNPTLQVKGGSTFTISIDFMNLIHPFGFSPKGNTDAVSLTTTYFPNDLNTGTGYSIANCDTSASTAVNVIRTNTTKSCVVTLQTPTTGGTFYYRCAYHPQMVGTINIIGNTASTIAGAGMAIVVAIIATIMM